jgi:GntR family transcriptional regulator, histidine utilization repressor
MTEKKTYRDVKADVLRRIADKSWGPGTLLPGEVDLAAEYGCARATVNRAMRELTDEGLLERKRRSGTRVRLAPLRQARFDIPVMREEIEALGAEYRYTMVENQVRIVPNWLRAQLGLAPGTMMRHVICMHYADGAPYQFENRWINLDALPEAETADFSAVGPNEWLVRAVPYSEAEISFAAEGADKPVAEYLGMKLGEPVFAVERTTWWEGKPLTYVRLCFRRGHRMTTRY